MKLGCPLLVIASLAFSGCMDSSGSARVGAFVVDVSLSHAAKEQFSRSGESVIVSATYLADPATDAPTRMIDEIGMVDLGSAQVDLPDGEGRAAFDGSAFRNDRLRFIEGEALVNINVWSGRKSSPDNLLDCDMFQDSVTVAARQPIAIDCRLLDEDDEGA